MAEPRTVRVYWGRFKGRVNLNYNWGGVIHRGSVVHVTACEYLPARAGEVFADDPAPTPWITGAANITIHGVAPHTNPDGVGFIVTVDWDEPLPIVTDITVFDPPEQVDLGQLVEQ
jgi:hypothetical protein